ncbi:MAG TPA: magnesium transporter [Pedococcus sp.]|uniref:magnesium transporter n=1 Tax=Pedococcus sp. TaxID=2860345 RepID=UPI002F95EADA
MEDTTSTAAPDVAPLLPGSIEHYLAVDVPVCAATDRAREIRSALVGRTHESVADIAVCRGPSSSPRLLGLLPVERLLGAADDSAAEDLMDADPPVVAPGLSQEKAAWKAVRHGESSLAVVDAEGVFRGLVPPARLLSVLLREHDEDLARLGGYMASTSSARHATEEPLGRRLWHRMPWLLVGLAGSAVAAWVVGGFESQIEQDVRLAFFVPGIVYMADAVGTQTEALVIRGLSVGVPIGRVFRLEVLTGLVVGVLLGLTSFPAVWAVFGSASLATAVSASLLAACGVATIVAMMLPWAMDRLGKDPAFGSGPLATVIQDVLSLVIYFAIATAIVV